MSSYLRYILTSSSQHFIVHGCINGKHDQSHISQANAKECACVYTAIRQILPAHTHYTHTSTQGHKKKQKKNKQALCNGDGELDAAAFERLIRHQLQVSAQHPTSAHARVYYSMHKHSSARVIRTPTVRKVCVEGPAGRAPARLVGTHRQPAAPGRRPVATRCAGPACVGNVTAGM